MSTKNAAHTPGPWAWDSRNGKHYLVTCSSDSPHAIVLGWPCGLEDGTWFTQDDCGSADARLIAAAPELLSACRFALETFPGANDDERAVFLAAIAKAEGR